MKAPYDKSQAAAIDRIRTHYEMGPEAEILIHESAELEQDDTSKMWFKFEALDYLRKPVPRHRKGVAEVAWKGEGELIHVLLFEDVYMGDIESRKTLAAMGEGAEL